MLDPLDFENRPLIDKLQRKRLATFLIVLLERVSLLGWRMFFWTLLFLGLWMVQIPALFGEVGGIITLLIFLAGFSYFAGLDMPGFKFPSRSDVDRRLEKENHLRHRPVSELDDTLANPVKSTTRTLWDEGRKSMLRALGALKTPKPQALLASRDPYAIRLGITLFFLIGVVMAGPQWDERIFRGLTPFHFKFLQKPADDISIWITPPEYTGAQQIVLTGSGRNKDVLSIPYHSEVKVRVTGGLGHPAFVIGEQSIPLKHLGGDTYGFEMKIPAADSFAIRQMFITRTKWHYALIPDLPPTLSAAADFEVLKNEQLRFPLTVYDDYGVRDLSMEMTLDDMITEAPIGQPVKEVRSIMSPPKTQFDIQPVYDLTAHPWAGLPVVIQFSASDHQDQSVAMEPYKITLPERVFRHPVAKQLVELRKQLAWSPLESSPEVGRKLFEVLRRPGEFQNDLVVFLALRTASSRLHYSPGMESAKAVIALLWDTALRIEDGNLSLAMRHLRDAQMSLEEALQNQDITDEEIAALMDELRAAMAEYMTELQKELQKRMASGEMMPMIPPEALSSMISPDALSSFLDQMESEMMSGERKSAQEMLSQLQRMLDMLNPSMNSSMPPDMQFMSDGISEIQELIERQQQLLDQTRAQTEILDFMRSNKQGFGSILPPDSDLMRDWGLGDMPPPPEEPVTVVPGVNTQENKAEQEALRFILGQLMMEAAEKLGDVPEHMGLAEQEMRGSSAALSENQPVTSVPHQEKAIEYLREAMKQMSQQLMARMKQMTGMALSGGMRFDPLGRPYGGDGDQPGLFPGSRVQIPDEAQQKRVEEILKLLRRRSGELDRPEDELEYFRRLLRQF